MNAGLAVQWGVVGLAVAASAAYVVRRQAPRAAAAWRRRLAIVLLRPARGPLLRRMGRWLAPPASVRLPASGGCGDCGERKSCAASTTREA